MLVWWCLCSLPLCIPLSPDILLMSPVVQGFASGDLERDAAAIRLFAEAGLELLLAQVLTQGELL